MISRTPFVALSMVALIAAGCGTKATSPDIVEGRSHGHSQLHGSLAVDTVDKLMTQSDKVAVVEVVDEEWRGEANGFARVIFRVRTVEPIKGTKAGEVIRFSQPDPARQVGIWVPPEVKAGNQYLMFLERLSDNAAQGGPATGAYVSWLGESIYVRVGGEWVRRVKFETGGDTPATIGDAEIERALNGLTNGTTGDTT